jgi:hypothetical protein
MDMSHNEGFAKAVALFLAEGLRTTAISKARAGEIAEKVLAHINLMDNETHFLSFIRELSRDFQELRPLERKLEREQQMSETRSLGDAIREYAVEALHSEPAEALEILKAAGEPGFSQASIYVRFPKFKDYHQKKHAKQ